MSIFISQAVDDVGNRGEGAVAFAMSAVPPAKIQSFRLSNVQHLIVTLQWIAVGDDGLSGKGLSSTHGVMPMICAKSSTSSFISVILIEAIIAKNCFIPTQVAWLLVCSG